MPYYKENNKRFARDYANNRELRVVKPSPPPPVARGPVVPLWVVVLLVLILGIAAGVILIR